MTEEEKILSTIMPIVNARKTHKDDYLYSLQLNAFQLDMLQGLLDLYNKEKEKNKELYKDNQKQWEERCKLAIELDNNTISKDKIKEKIEELEQDIEKQEKETLGRCITIGQAYAIKVLKELLEEGK